MLAKLLLICKLFGPIFGQIFVSLREAVATRLHRLTYRAVENPRNVVVVGASFAGYHAAKCLASSLPTGYRVVIIEKNTHFQLTWVLPRFSVVNGHEHKAFIPYGPYLDRAPKGSYQWVRDSVEHIVPGENGHTGKVELASGEEVEFDYLVLATGASGALPSRVPAGTKQEGIEQLLAEQERLQAATDVIIVGGGAAGIELVADVKSRYPEKNVTLVHSRKTLLGRFGGRIGERALQALEELGVVTIMGERVLSDSAEEGNIKLSSGETLACDYLVKCVGQHPNSKLIQALSPESISETGHVKVRPTLQISDMSLTHIYAAGDVVDMDNIKNGRAAVQQAQSVAHNIVRSIRSQNQLEYRPQWWEGMTKLHVGLGKALIWMGDGSAEIIMSAKCRAEELDSAKVWKFFGVKPYADVGYELRRDEI
ncbi:putative mercuric reductase [Aspergillus nomiae NRRL 13137]|uniref:Putative mercuric reductase n=1 Tax=Aspergillus nomiae NRRL (strain ATCC 15546 / NRRL 13137 / CBS 260.88 / M93) TaxID=1509407 RepID=A0A0L1IXV8_ASPN3|nr:putative mercuric reductase [Aspergillus nomiae NRRL 13137]KNG84339.1 putative mercuric reductase [Aspergillus nomiae NRRL 13137]